MPAFALTAAEIAAAEAAAIAAAEAAAIQAAQVAAAEAAAAAAAEAAAAQAATQAATQAGTQAAAQAGTQAATQASTSGIQALAQEVGTTVQPTGIEQVVNAGNYPGSATNPLSPMAQTTVVPPSPATLVEGANAAPPASTSLNNLTPDAWRASQGHEAASPLYTVDQAAASASAAAPPPAPTPASTIPPRPDNALYQFQGPTTPEGLQTGARLDSALQPSGDPFYNINSGHIDQTLGRRPGFGLTDVAVEPSAMSSNLPAQPATGLQGLLDKGIAYAKDNPISTGLGAMSLYNYLNRPEPYKKPKYQSTFNASTYRGYEPTPPTPYTPQYAQYAQGGLADLGGYSDYARGGRMLKGPGDGMSDDIPAIIANKQPAKLANEEFVVPADVVSHLGNGSSEAGAKALYKMMDRVRQARTGNKKQGKQINPEKYLA